MTEMAAAGIGSVTDAQLNEMASMLSASIAEAQKAGVDIGSTLANSLEGMTPETQAAVDALYKAAEGGAQSGGEAIGNKGAEGVNSTAAANREAGTNVANEAKSGMESVDTQPSGYSAGADYGDGIYNGVMSRLGRIRAAAQQITSILNTTTRAGLREKSPSKIAEQIGAYYGEGLAIGLNGQQRAVAQASAGLTGSIIQRPPAAIVDYPTQQAEMAARSITVNTPAAQTDGAVNRALGVIINQLGNLDVNIRNGGQVMDTVTNSVNRRLGRIATLEGSGVI